MGNKKNKRGQNFSKGIVFKKRRRNKIKINDEVGDLKKNNNIYFYHLARE